ncbi:MAG TPA: efflux RND transporter periplasmic adaptor subunit [Myxococcota bacterium]
MQSSRFLIASALALGLAASSGCHHEEHHKEERSTLHVTTPLRRTTEVTREYVGQVRAIQHIEVRALERGYLEGVFVDEGQLVKQGQKMFQLMPRILQAEVHKEEAEAARADIEFNNTKLLADQKIVSQNELALSKVGRDRANAQLELARAHRGLTEIRAPFTGIMGRFQARQGSLLDEGDLLTTLSDNSVVWVYFNVSEAEYLQYKAEEQKGSAPQEVQLKMANGQLYPQMGTVETIEADFDNETGTIAFRAAFKNDEGLLRHGETGKIVMTSTLDNAQIVPQQATFDVLDRKFVYVVDDKGTVNSKPITVLAELPQIFAIEGLNDTDQILLEGLRKVHEGSEITAAMQNPDEVLKHLEVPAE